MTARDDARAFIDRTKPKAHLGDQWREPGDNRLMHRKYLVAVLAEADATDAQRVERERALVRAAWVEGRMHEGQRDGEYAYPDDVRIDRAAGFTDAECDAIREQVKP